jgi:triacylglycerol lipase
MEHLEKRRRVMIAELDIKAKSLLFAKLASIAYGDTKEVKKAVKELGFTNGGAQAYRLESKTDVVVACRGTQPTEFNDIKADLKAIPVMAETISRVHQGFKTEVDELWPLVCLGCGENKIKTKSLWFCGHSLGAAMATIMAARCMADPEVVDPVQLYTYGSPRVGWPAYVKSLKIDHIRWVNNNDIVTRVPFRIMGYRHHGTEKYINSMGDVTPPTLLSNRFSDRMKGMWMGLKKGSIDNFADHSMVNYIEYLERWNTK